MKSLVTNGSLLFLSQECKMTNDPVLSYTGMGARFLRESTVEFFTVCTKLAEMAILYSKDLTTAKKLPPVGLDLMLQIITGLGVQ